ncbi:unnamed protein product [Gongylonema pulchrum]|uniref:Fibrinogen-binding protein n=1 Tax=Gongylonema pulchrum TaxID=637853 RepID=A0A183EYD7_9BILA|nr:unnamed protein product [Gongylonema pulchrum]
MDVDCGLSGADGVGGRDDDISRIIDLSSGGSVVVADKVGGRGADAGADDFTFASSGTDGGGDDDVGCRVDLSSDGSVDSAVEVGGTEVDAGADDITVGSSDTDAGLTAGEVVRTEANAGADDFTPASSGIDGGRDDDDDIGRKVDLATAVTVDEVDGREADAGTDESNVGDFFGTSDNDACGIGCDGNEVSGGAAGWADVFDEGEDARDAGSGNSVIGVDRGSSGADDVSGRDDDIGHRVDLSSDGSVVTADEVGGTEAGAGADDFTVRSSGTDGGRDDEIGRRVDLATVIIADKVDGREAGEGADESNVGDSLRASDSDAGGIGCDDDEVSGGAARYAFDEGEVKADGVADRLSEIRAGDSEDAKPFGEDG